MAEQREAIINLPQSLQEDWEFNNHANASLIIYLDQQARSGKALPDRAVELGGHIVASMRRWLGILGHPDYQGYISGNRWPKLQPSGIQVEFLKTSLDFGTHINGQSEQTLNEVLTYPTADGSETSATRLSIIKHSMLHSQGHRAQMLVLLKEASPDCPLDTDFIRWSKSR